MKKNLYEFKEIKLDFCINSRILIHTPSIENIEKIK